jgi:hypothetical protein
MIQQAIDSMATVKSIGEKEAKEKKIQLILEILGIAFIFIPFLDDLAPELEALDGVFNTISTIGNVGLGIESIVSDPSSAPMALLGLLAGGKLRSDKDFEAAAAARRALTDDDLEKIGSNFQETDSKFQDTIKPSCRT